MSTQLGMFENKEIKTKQSKITFDISDSEIGKKMTHIVSLSGGLASFGVAERVINRYGKKNVILLFADVLDEDPDLYRFLVDIENYFDMKITIIAESRTPWQVFFDVSYIGNDRVDPCSKLLKRDFIDQWIKSRFNPYECIIYIGFDWTEIHRYEGYLNRPDDPGLHGRKLPYYYEAPLLWEPMLSKPQIKAHVESIGIDIPRLYKAGFANNNCRGCCIKAGVAQWVLLLKTYPDRYLETEEREQRFIQEISINQKNGHKGIIKRSVKGKIKYYTLKQFREAYETQPSFLTEDDLIDWGSCHCAF